MKFLIIDDEPLARERIREMLKKEGDVELIDDAENGGEAIEKIKSGEPDIIFLDIQMPDMDGFQVLEKLGTEILSHIPAIIFVTAFDQHALRAFEFHALDYLLKPFDRERFAETLGRAKPQQINTREANSDSRRILNLLEQINTRPEYLEWLTVKKNERIRFSKVSEVQWIDPQGNYVSYRFPDRSEALRETMDSVENQLDPRTFVRIHRSAIINVNYIKELQVWRRGEYRVVMLDKKAFTLSRGYRHRFDEFLKKRSA